MKTARILLIKTTWADGWTEFKLFAKGCLLVTDMIGPNTYPDSIPRAQEAEGYREVLKMIKSHALDLFKNGVYDCFMKQRKNEARVKKL